MIQPIGDRVLVRPLAVEEKTKSGIILSTNEKEKKAEGEVVAIGDTESFKIGDKVIYSQYAGEDYKTLEEGSEIVYKFLKTEEILAIIS